MSSLNRITEMRNLAMEKLDAFARKVEAGIVSVAPDGVKVDVEMRNPFVRRIVMWRLREDGRPDATHIVAELEAATTYGDYNGKIKAKIRVDDGHKYINERKTGFPVDEVVGLAMNAFNASVERAGRVMDEFRVREDATRRLIDLGILRETNEGHGAMISADTTPDLAKYSIHARVGTGVDGETLLPLMSVTIHGRMAFGMENAAEAAELLRKLAALSI